MHLFYNISFNPHPLLQVEVEKEDKEEKEKDTSKEDSNKKDVKST